MFFSTVRGIEPIVTLKVDYSMDFQVDYCGSHKRLKYFFKTNKTPLHLVCHCRFLISSFCHCLSLFFPLSLFLLYLFIFIYVCVCVMSSILIWNYGTNAGALLNNHRI